MRKSFILICLVFFFSGKAIFAQTGSIHGTVTASGSRVATATVSLLSAVDSSWIRTELTNDSGTFALMNILAGEYIISISSIGFVTTFKKIIVKDNADAPCATELQKADASLAGVVITGKKPFMEMSLGKLTVNVEGSATTAGSNALDLMKRLPGMTVTADGSISMQGKQEILVLIDDRPTYLSGDQLAEYLRTITADEIAQLELITQPGAKYDAAGNTGVINIKLKKNKKQGFNGNAAIALGQGVYPVMHGNLLLNYRKNKLNLSLSASDFEAKGFGDWTEHQYFIDPATGAVTGTNDIHSTPWERFGIASLRLSADYSWTEQTSIGASVRATYHPNSSHGYISSVSTDNVSSSVVYNNMVYPDGFIRKDAVTNAYLTHKFNKESSLDINLDYLAYGNYAWQDVSSMYYDGQMQPLPNPLILHSNQPSLINVWSAKVDHTYTFKDGLKLESGLKSSYVTTDNNAIFTSFQNNAWVDDATRSNHFIYKENINAAYVTAAKSFGKQWEAKGGLRAEQTNATGIQYVHDSRFDRNYISLFPTAYMTYKADSNNQFEVNYGRRIDRPAYRLLNPFITYSFQYNYSVGNPYLLPQYTNDVELKHSYKNMIISSIGFTNTTDVINSVLITDSVTKKVYITNKNIASGKTIDGYIIFNKELFKWWTLNVSGYLFYSTFSGLINGKSATHEGVGYSLHWNMQFDCGKGWKAETNGYYNDDNIRSLIETYGKQLYMEFGISKKVKDNIQIKLSSYDPFYLSRLYIHNSLGNFRSGAVFRNATQQVAIEFTYSFGKSQSANRNVNTIDEANRIK